MYGEVVSIPESLVISLVSMAVVFLVLLAISFMIDINAAAVKGIGRAEERKKSSSGSASEFRGDKEEPKPQAAQERFQHEHAVLVAAAIAAYLGTSIENVVVRRIAHIADSDSAWARQALQDNVK